VASGSHPQRADRATAAARGLVGARAVREGVPGARTGDASAAGAGPGRLQRDRRAGQLPAGTADPGRRRRRERHRASSTMPICAIWSTGPDAS
jgi:hypothetical protein